MRRRKVHRLAQDRTSSGAFTYGKIGSSGCLVCIRPCRPAPATRPSPSVEPAPALHSIHSTARLPRKLLGAASAGTPASRPARPGSSSSAVPSCLPASTAPRPASSSRVSGAAGATGSHHPQSRAAARGSVVALVRRSPSSLSSVPVTCRLSSVARLAAGQFVGRPNVVSAPSKSGPGPFWLVNFW